MNNSKIKIIGGTLFIILFLFQNCSKKGFNNVGQSATAQQILTAKSVDLLTQKCSQCHTGEKAYSNVVFGAEPITDIANVDYLLRTRLIIPGEPELSPIYKLVSSTDMPPDKPLNLDEVNLIKDWITNFNADANSSSGGGLTPVPLAPNYSSLNVNVFLSKCFTCHTNRNVRLNTYDSVASAIMNNNLRSRINNNTMPPANAPQLSAQERMFVLQWIDAGAPNN